MNATLLSDLYRYIGKENRSVLKQLRYIFFTPGFQYTWLMRHVNMASNPVTRTFWRILLRRCMFHTGIQIPPSTAIGPGLRISHFGPIVVNPAARIGSNFSIAQGALIGSADGRNKGVPTIGDEVIMSANSIVVGGVTIGSRVMVAPGAFVNFDVPDDSIVIGNPGKIIRKEYPTKNYNVYLA